ncbi:MAG TPA: VWA domain-containing protein [Pyrinomonadaceae bacterium]|jgi:VWFA-related protein
MKTRLRQHCAALTALAITFSALPPAGRAQASPPAAAVFDRALNGTYRAVVIENRSGRTQVQTWNGGRVRVVAEQTGGGAVAARLSFAEVVPATVKIAVRPDERGAPVALAVYVPPNVSLTVRGGAAEVVVSGSLAATSVETEAGDIALRLPAAADTDLSARTLAGSISSQLPLAVFGPLNTHALDGRLGAGGAPVILRSTSGAISLAADEPTRFAQAGRQPAAPGASDSPLPVERAARARDAGAGPDDAPPAADAAYAAASGPRAHDAAGNARPGAGATRSDEEVIRVNTRLVALNARVTDAAGKLIPDLKREDFQVFEDGVEQEIVHFEPVTAPVNLVLLLDLSGSTKDRMKVMKKAAKKFVDSLAPNTRIAAAAFTRRFLVISDFTDDRKLLKDRIEHVKNLNSGTAFYDSLWATLDLFDEVREKRKAVVVLTDGVDNSLAHEEYEPRHPFDELLARVAQEEVTIYPIYFDTEYETIVRRRGQDTHEAYVTARRQLQQVADDTGGTLFKAERAEDLEGVYQRVASELHTLYSVAYDPKDRNYDGRWRDLSIKIKGGRGTARTKRGYYAH